MPGKIRNPAAYHATVKRNRAISGFLKKTGRGIASYAKKKVRSYVHDPSKLAKDYRRGAAFVKAIQGSGDYDLKHTGVHGVDGGVMAEVRGHHSHEFYHRPSARRTQLEKGEMCISHSEYIGELVSSGTTGTSNFVSQNYGINPGNPGTFPWLSAIAINFQDYRFKKLIFEYRPLVSESTSTTAATLTSMGSIIMSTQYDSTKGPYVNKNTMENADFSQSCKPSDRRYHGIECNPRFNPLGTLYVSGGIGTNTSGVTDADIRFQNLGLFQIASSNIPIASSTALDLGEIWVHYEVELYKPQLNAGLYNLLSAHYYFNTGVSGGAPFGNPAAPTAATTNYLPLTFTTNTFSFPLAVTDGAFLCIYIAQTQAAANNLGTPSVTNGSLVTLLQSATGVDDSASAMPMPQASLAGQTTTGITFVVSVNAPGAALCTVTIPGTTFGVAPQGELLVTPWNLGIDS